MTGLQLGCVAFLDILGFKGIWNREKAGAVLDKMRQIKRTGKGLQGSDRSGVLVSDDGFDHRVKCVSDTILVSVVPRGRRCKERMLYKAMFSTAWIAGWIIREALDGAMPLLLRGCMSVGWLRLEGDFMIGPAVDDAAGLFEEADGPFFWMSPTALTLNDEFAETFHDRIEPGLMVRYPVPLKRGKIETLVHTYFGVRSKHWPQTRLRIKNAFGENLDRRVRKKLANADAFLDHIEEVAQVGTRDGQAGFRMPYWDDLTFSQRLQILKHSGFDADSKFPRRSEPLKLL